MTEFTQQVDELETAVLDLANHQDRIHPPPVLVIIRLHVASGVVDHAVEAAL